MKPAYSAPWLAAIAVGCGVVVGLAGWGFLNVGGLRARPGYCVGVALALAILIAAVRFVADRVDPGPSVAEPPSESGQRPYADLYFLEYRLSWGSVERARYEQRVRPLLTRIADERLRQRHGVDRSAEPGTARGIVGEQLWQLMDGPPKPEAKPPTHRQISEIVRRIEQI